MVVFGVVGLLGNTVSILLRSRVQGGNLNTRAALLEVVNDALGSVAVLVAAAVIWLTGWARADAVGSLVIAVMILPRTWKLLRETIDVLMGGPREGVDLGDVRAHILDLSACAAAAIGAWVVRDGKAEWQPAFDLTTVIVTSNAVALVALIVLRRQFARRAVAS
jgi:Co/Zn/Cd efflux system component